MRPSKRHEVGVFDDTTFLLKPTDPRLPWDPHDQRGHPFLFGACHAGQLKLLYAELLFLTLASERMDLSKCVVVYVGAAPGDHHAMLCSLFPTLQWILYDPAPFRAVPSIATEIHNVLFDDAQVGAVLANPRVAGKRILFISDIRRGNEDEAAFEREVLADMVAQQRWTLLLGAAGASLKFRMPYDQQFEYDATTLTRPPLSARIVQTKKAKTKADGAGAGAGAGLLYLAGDLYRQVYAPAYSTELRLVTFPDARGRFSTQRYAFDWYEGACFHHNVVERRRSYVLQEEPEDTKKEQEKKDKKKQQQGARADTSLRLADHLAGMGDTYESVAEYWMVRKYLGVVHNTSPAHMERSAVTLLFHLRSHMAATMSRSMRTCMLATSLKSVQAPGGLERLQQRQERSLSIEQLRAAVDAEASAHLAEADRQMARFNELARGTQAAALLTPAQYLQQVAQCRNDKLDIAALAKKYNKVIDTCAGRGCGHV